MPSIRQLQNKSGDIFYEIRVSRGRDKAPLSMRWYAPDGWSKKAIDRELTKVAAEFERKCNNGEIISRKEQKELERLQELENAKIKTLYQYGERVFMPAKTITMSENARSNYQSYLNNWIYPALGEMRLQDITPAQINELLLSMQAQKKSHSTVIKCYTVLRSLFKMAYLDDTLDRNPVDKVERPKPRKDEPQRNTEAYTADELKYILECLEHEPLKWRVLVLLLIDTGMRRGECCALQWKDVDFSANTITVSGNLCYTPAKGVYLDTPKNSKNRTIDIDPAIMSMLRDLQAEQAESCLSRFVFSQNNSPDPIHPQSPTRYLKRFSERYNVPALHPHKLRHSFASVAITSGADIASVSEKLGHSDKAVTLRMYTHADKESIKKASDIFRSAIKEA